MPVALALAIGSPRSASAFAVAETWVVPLLLIVPLAEPELAVTFCTTPVAFARALGSPVKPFDASAFASTSMLPVVIVPWALPLKLLAVWRIPSAVAFAVEPLKSEKASATALAVRLPLLTMVVVTSPVAVEP